MTTTRGRTTVRSISLIAAVVGLGVGSAPPPPLLDNVGTYSRPVHTSSDRAQRYFDQGLRFTFGYYFPEAIASFLEAIRQDPECAMCHWGLALAISPNPNSRRGGKPDDPQGRGRQAAQEAMALRANASEQERAFIEALAVRYDSEAHRDRHDRDLAYVDAARAVFDRYPEDAEAGALLADAIMTASPWDYWRPDGTPRPLILEAKAALEKVLRRDIDHTWANHLYLHLMEDSSTPEAALPHADRLEATMPGAGHIVHMPSHIYVRVGQYAKVTAQNERSVEADRRLLELWGDADLRTDIGSYALSSLNHPSHAYDFLHMAALLRGNRAAAMTAAAAMLRLKPLDKLEVTDSKQSRAVKGSLARVRFGRWEEILAEPLPKTEIPYVIGFGHFARGLASNARGMSSEAVAHLVALRAMAADPTLADLPVRRNPASKLLELAATLLEGEIAMRNGHLDEALARLETAVRLEDALAYIEPPDWLLPTRHFLGAALLEAGRPAEAEVVYWADLRRNPENGWSLFGLRQSLDMQGKTEAAAEVEQRFRRAWAGADVTLTASRY